MATQTAYAIGDLKIAVTGLKPSQAERLHALWQRCFAVKRSHPAKAHVQLRFRSQPSPLVEANSQRQPFHAAQLRSWQTPMGFSVQCGASLLDLDLLHNRANGILDDSFWNHPWEQQQGFFLFTLIALLRQHGRYTLHANALVHQDASYLIVGSSGAGKTTLTACLLRQGWASLGDDALMLQDVPPGIQALALRRGFAFTPDTLDCFPDLATQGAIGQTAAGKHLVDLAALYPQRFVPRCQPTVLLFPQIEARQQTQLRPLSAATAFVNLAQQTVGITTDPTPANQQLDLLARLVQQCRSYQLLLGTDVYEEPGAVAALLQNVKRA
jgi:hypothetical protein